MRRNPPAPVDAMYACRAAGSVVGMCPITTLAARSRSDIAATAFSAGVPSAVGAGEGAAGCVGEDDGLAAGAGAQDAHIIAVTASIAASRVVRRAEVIRQA